MIINGILIYKAHVRVEKGNEASAPPHLLLQCSTHQLPGHLLHTVNVPHLGQPDQESYHSGKYKLL